MKLSINRKKESGYFGRTYYESNISLTLTNQEKEIVQKLNLERVSLIGGLPGKNSHDEIRVLTLAAVSTGGQNLTLKDLVNGISAKAGSDDLLCELVNFENILTERCKNLENRIESHVVDQQKFVGQLDADDFDINHKQNGNDKSILLTLIGSILLILLFARIFLWGDAKQNSSQTTLPSNTNSSIQQPSISPSKIISDYYKNLKSSNYEVAWSYLPQKMQNDLSLHPKGYQSFIDWYRRVGNIDINSVNLQSDDGKNAVVNASTNYTMKSNGSLIKVNLTYFLTKETNNEWKISKIKKN